MFFHCVKCLVALSGSLLLAPLGILLVVVASKLASLASFSHAWTEVVVNLFKIALWRRAPGAKASEQISRAQSSRAPRVGESFASDG